MPPTTVSRTHLTTYTTLLFIFSQTRVNPLIVEAVTM